MSRMQAEDLIKSLIILAWDSNHLRLSGSSFPNRSALHKIQSEQNEKNRHECERIVTGLDFWRSGFKYKLAHLFLAICLLYIYYYKDTIRQGKIPTDVVENSLKEGWNCTSKQK